MRSARRRRLLLLAVVLGALCRKGHADDTTPSATTAKGSFTSGATTANPQSPGSAAVGPSPATSVSGTSPDKQTTPSVTTPTLKPTQGSVSTGASVLKSTSKDGSTKASNMPATSPSGASPVKATSPALNPTTVTTASAFVPPRTGVTAVPPLQAATTPSAPGSAMAIAPSGGTSAKSVANISPSQKTSELPTEKPTVSSAASQGPGTTKPGSVAVNQHTIPTTNALSPGSSGGSGPRATPTASQAVTPNVMQPTTNTKPAGTPGATAHPSTGQPVTSSPKVSVLTTATEGRPPQEVPTPHSQGNPLWFLGQTQFLCENAIPSASEHVVFTLSQAKPCESFIKSPLEEPLLDMICKTQKPNFNRSRDHCLVRLASVMSKPDTVAIIGVSVQMNSVAEELFESLKMKEGELKKLGVNVSYAGQYADMDSEDRFSMPLIITIVCMAASLLLVAAIYGCCHQRISQRKDQQRLTEELQTMENGYHDNPTLEVMETSSEMQEKKVNLIGELGDSWIVPMDNLTKEDLEEEEDTHL